MGSCHSGIEIMMILPDAELNGFMVDFSDMPAKAS
jgi:hypothetical protein